MQAITPCTPAPARRLAKRRRSTASWTTSCLSSPLAREVWPRSSTAALSARRAAASWQERTRIRATFRVAMLERPPAPPRGATGWPPLPSRPDRSLDSSQARLASPRRRSPPRPPIHVVAQVLRHVGIRCHALRWTRYQAKPWSRSSTLAAAATKAAKPSKTAGPTTPASAAAATTPAHSLPRTHVTPTCEVTVVVKPGCFRRPSRFRPPPPARPSTSTASSSVLKATMPVSGRTRCSVSRGTRLPHKGLRHRRLQHHRFREWPGGTGSGKGTNHGGGSSGSGTGTGSSGTGVGPMGTNHGGTGSGKGTTPWRHRDSGKGTNHGARARARARIMAARDRARAGHHGASPPATRVGRADPEPASGTGTGQWIRNRHRETETGAQEPERGLLPLPRLTRAAHQPPEPRASASPMSSS